VSKASELLETTPPFNEFDGAILDRFHTTANEKQFSPGEVLFHEMSQGDEIYFIVEGNIRMSVELASAYHMIEEIEGGPGELAGEGRFIADGPRPATVTAITPVSALVWSVDDWKTIADENPLVGYQLAVFAGQVLFARVGKLKNHLINDMSWGIE